MFHQSIPQDWIRGGPSPSRITVQTERHFQPGVGRVGNCLQTLHRRLCKVHAGRLLFLLATQNQVWHRTDPKFFGIPCLCP